MVLANLGKQYNLLRTDESGGQPPAVARLIAREVGTSTGTDAVLTAVDVMRRHFWWLYFTERTIVGMAHDTQYLQPDEMANVTRELGIARAALEGLLDAELKPELSLYFDQVRAALSDEKRTTARRTGRGARHPTAGRVSARWPQWPAAASTRRTRRCVRWAATDSTRRC